MSSESFLDLDVPSSLMYPPKYFKSALVYGFHRSVKLLPPWNMEFEAT